MTRLLLLASASLLAMTAHASAEPISATIAFLASGGGLFAGGTITVAGLTLPQVATLALSVGSAVASAIAGRQKPQTREIKQTSQGAEGPGLHAFGRVEAEGRLLFGNTSGYFISRLTGHAFGELDSVEAYFYDGREITVEADGYVSTPPWARLTGPGEYDTPSFMNVQTKVGDGTETAWASLISDYPSLWTADHRNRGIAQTLMRIENPGVASSRFAALLQSGVKAIRVRGRFLKPYDPRTATNAWTLNGVLICLHYLRALNGVADADIDFTGIEAVADAAEVSVTTLTGTAARCQLSGGWEGPLTTDIVDDMLESAGLETYTTADGKTSLRFLEDWPEPEITLTARHIIDNFPQSGPDSGRRPNICNLSFFSPERRYEKAEIALHEIDSGTGDYLYADWARLADEIDKYGEQEFRLDLTFCCDASQAQRIARRLFHMARADFGLLKTNWAGMACWGKRTALIEIPDVGEDGASVFVRARLGPARPNDAEGTVEIPYRIIPDILETAWNAATDEAPAPPVLEPQQSESDLTTPGAPTEACLVEYPSGSRELRVAYPNPGTPGSGTTEAVYRVYSDDVPGVSQSMTEGDGSVYFAWATAGDNLLPDHGFDTGTGWTTASGWTIASGKATKTTPGTANGVSATVTLTNGVSYTIGGVISDRTAGALTPRFVGGAVLDGTAVSANGAFEQVMVATADHTTCSFRSDTSFDGSVDDVYLYATASYLPEGTKLDFRVRIFNSDGDGSYYSDAFVVESLAIDNTAPTAPTVSIETYVGEGAEPPTLLRLTFTPSSLSVVKAVVEFTDNSGGSWAAFATYEDVRPGPYVVDTDEQVAVGKGFRVTLYSSNDAAGPSGEAIYTG